MYVDDLRFSEGDLMFAKWKGKITSMNWFKLVTDSLLNEQGLTSAARLSDVTTWFFGHLHGGEDLEKQKIEKNLIMMP